MTRADLKELICRVVARLAEPTRDDAPTPACLWGDTPEPCDVTTAYGIGEEG